MKNNLKIYLQKFAYIKLSSYICSVIINNNNLKRRKTKAMTTGEITKTINKLNEILELAKTDAFYNTSLGFQRMSVLPKRVRRNINLACVVKGESNTNSMKEFLNTLNEQEFINWLKLA